MKKNKKISKFVLVSLTLITLFLVGSQIGVQAQTSVLPLLVNDLPISSLGDAQGDKAAVAFDGTNYLVVWHAASGDLMGQFVDKAGTFSGSSLYVLSGTSYPAISFNGDNYLVVGSQNGNIVGKLIARDGSMSSQIAISNAPDCGYPDIAWNQRNFLVTWVDRRAYTTNYFDVCGQLVTPSGSLSGQNFQISPSIKSQSYASVASDGNNYFVVWSEETSPYKGDLDVYGARIDASGTILDPSGISICTQPNMQGGMYSPEISFGRSDYLVTWADWRSGSSLDLYGARVSTAGTVLDTNGVAIASHIGGSPLCCPSAFDGTNWLVTWAVGSKTMAARVDQSGTVIDVNSATVSQSSGGWFPSLAYDNTNYLITWRTRYDQNSMYTVYGQLVSTGAIDSTPPTVSISSPIPGVSNIVRPVVWGNAADAGGSGLDNIQISIDSGPYIAASGTTYWEYIPTSPLSDGTHTITVLATDKAGNTQTASVTFTIDSTGPTATVSPVSGTLNPNTNWYISPSVTVAITATDPSGVSKIFYMVDAGQEVAVSGSNAQVTINGDGRHELTYWAQDSLGISGQNKHQSILIDTQQPTITASRAPDANGYGWNNHYVTVHFTASDSTSGITYVDPDMMVYEQGAGQSLTGTAVDGAGNIATLTVGNINLDFTPPTISGAPTSAPNSNGWYNKEVTIHFTASDALSGLVAQPYDITLVNEGQGQSATETVYDHASNTASATVSNINIDKTPPTIDLIVPETATQYELATATWTATDSLSGIDGQSSGAVSINTAFVGTATVTVTVKDNAGNIATATKTCNIQAPPVPPTVEFNPATSSVIMQTTQTATLTVHVTQGGIPLVGQQILFTSLPELTIDPNPQVTNSNGDATVTVTAATPGIYEITASIYQETPQPMTAASTASTVSSASTTLCRWTLVFYDPVGMTAGGGWYTPIDDAGNPMAGTANFGFIAKYQKGISTGNLEFQYHSEDGFNLKSTTIDYLIVSGTNAHFAGKATIDGVSGYYFRVTAQDNGEPGAGKDTFSIKIWQGDPNLDGQLIYSSHNTIAGGNIIIKLK